MNAYHRRHRLDRRAYRLAGELAGIVVTLLALEGYEVALLDAGEVLEVVGQAAARKATSAT
jgi:hypothetical protein